MGASGHLLLEKRRLFNTLRNFAKCKPFFYPSTGDSHVTGDLRFHEPPDKGSVPSCDLVAEWEEQLRRYQPNVRLGEMVTDVQKTDKFPVVTDQRTYVCDRVILCVGKLVYLTPLNIGKEAEPKVFYEPQVSSEICIPWRKLGARRSSKNAATEPPASTVVALRMEPSLARSSPWDGMGCWRLGTIRDARACFARTVVPPSAHINAAQGPST